MTRQGEIPNLVHELVDATIRAFLTLRWSPSAFRSYASGCWQVFASKHPECAPHRADFFKLAGESLDQLLRKEVA